MNFLDLDKKLTEQEVSAVENEIAIVFPKPLRAFFLKYNGGSPEHYVYESETLNTVVNETLPLMSHSNRGTAVQTYRNLVLGKKLSLLVTFFLQSMAAVIIFSAIAMK